MGDTRRFEVLASFISRNFKPCKVADVAGGTGLLSYFLLQYGFTPTVIDPRNSNLLREFRRYAHKISRIRSEFSSNMAVDFDLIIGLHPDGATKAICESGKPCVVVPCCNFWKRGSDIILIVRDYFQRHFHNWFETSLPINGKNTVFVKKA